jgi:serine/threonine-protein kinase
MSPEQARGDSEVTPAADLYSIGVILYEMLVGHVPITGENYNQLIWRVMNGEYEPPRVRRPELPAELEQIILRAMAIEPRARFASAVELEHALLEFCRAGYREHMIERISNAGIPWGTPPPTTAPPHRQSQPPAGLGGTDPTLLAPSGMIAAPRRSKLPLILGAVVLLGGGAAAMVAVQQRSDPPAAAPAPVAATPPDPPPVPAPAAAPSGPIAVAPARVTIKFMVEPSTAMISVDGKPVTAELVIDKDPASHVVSITADGYVPHTEKLTFDESQRLVVKLEKQPPNRPVRPTRPARPGANSTDRIESQSPYGSKD